MSTKKSKGPLLYIHQPFARSPATNMQDTYTSRQEQVGLEKEMPREDEIQEQITKEVTKLENPSTTPHTKSPTKIHSSPQDKKNKSFNRVKPFKEMNIEERLDYLINYPKVLQPAPCVFVTEEKNYQGYLIGYDGQEATIRFHDQSTKIVPVNALKNIFLIGIIR